MASRVDQPIVRGAPDLVGFLETIYRPDPDPTSWARALMAAVEQVIDAPLGVGLVAIAHEDGYANARVVHAAASGSAMSYLEHTEALDGMVGAMTKDELHDWYYPGRPMLTFRGFATAASSAGEQFQRWHAGRGVVDMLALFAYPEPGMPVVLWVPAEGVLRASRAERRTLERISGHLDSAFRLRYRPDLAVAAVVSPGGRFLDIEEPEVRGGLRERLATTVVAIERTRLGEHRRELGALDHWHGLIAGRYSVVPREDTDGKRCYLLVANGATAQPHARFTQREIDVVRMAARGFTGKGIAYGLGLTAAAVSAALARAAAKVGLRSRTALVEAAAAMSGARADDLDPARLTAAELEVLELLRRGMTNEQIARLRARSARTVANQVASILHKTGHPSRRVLATAPLVGPD